MATYRPQREPGTGAPPPPLVLTGLVVVASLAVACSGGGHSPGVAGLGDGKTTTTLLAAGCARSCKLAAALSYAGCMRAHGVPGYADPVPVTGLNGKPGFSLSYSGDPNAPAFVTANDACKHYLPGGGVTGPLTAAQQHAWLAWAGCVRTHGFPEMPDPSFSGGAVDMPNLSGVAPGKINGAEKACARYLSGT